jgi:predicted helicase
MSSGIDKFIGGFPNWASLFAATCQLSENSGGDLPSKGNVFERLTQLYLRTHPEYQTKLKNVWLANVDLPRPIRAKLGLPPNDEGIDLVAETFDGEFWAIQSKFRSNTHKPLTVRDLSTFTNLAFNFCRGFSLALVVHTCAKPVRKNALLGRTAEIGLDRWLQLGEEDWQRIHQALKGPAKPPKKRNPREHQQKAIAAAKDHFVTAKASRGRMIMPCGTGKSLTAFWIARELEAKTILVAVPSLYLIKAGIEDWTKESLASDEIPEWLVVCSDETTGKIDQDEFVGQVYDLGIDATTDLDQIARFLKRRTTGRKIIFCTYQSGGVLAAATKKSGKVFDLGIFDEAHRTVGNPDKAFSLLVSDDNIRIRKRLFMTATERVARGEREDVLSMDDPATYGERFYQLTFKQAIEANPPIICDYKIVTIAVSDLEVKALVEENRYLSVDPNMSEQEAIALAAGVALQRTFDDYKITHAITFHRSIKAAENFKTQHEQLILAKRKRNRPVCFHVSSRKTTGERAELIQSYRAEPRAIMTNARCLQEGVDIPAVDCVMFADPKQSVVDIVQAAGRAMRPAEGKKLGYIVIPIVVPTNLDFAQFAGTEVAQQNRTGR